MADFFPFWLGFGYLVAHPFLTTSIKMVLLRRNQARAKTVLKEFPSRINRLKSMVHNIKVSEFRVLKSSFLTHLEYLEFGFYEF